jgi:hypothetical protein
MAENVVADYLTGKAVRLKVIRLADLFVLDWADGIFKSAGWTTPLKTVPENADTVGLYLTTADVSAWADGDYVFVLTDTLITTRPIAERTVRVVAGLVVELADVERWRALAPSVLISGRVDAATDAVMTRLGAPVGPSLSADIAALGIEPSVAFPNFQFEMYDLTGNLLPGLTVTASRVIGAGAYAPCANSPVEVGSGTYRIDFAASDLAGRPVTAMFEATGARPTKVELITSKR